MKGLFLGLVMVALVGLAWGDVEVWENEAAVGASYRSGNTDRSMYTMNVKRERYSDENDWLHSFYGEHGETEGLQTEGLARAQSEFRFRFANPDYFASIFTQGVHDSIRGIRFRGQLGPNVGYYVVQDERMKWDVAAGVNLTYDKGIEEEATYTGFRLASNFNWDFSEQASIYAEVELNGNAEEPTEDYYGWLVLGVKSGLLESVSMFAEMRNDYDNMPDAVGSERNDLLVTLGLVYDF